MGNIMATLGWNVSWYLLISLWTLTLRGIVIAWSKHWIYAIIFKLTYKLNEKPGRLLTHIRGLYDTLMLDGTFVGLNI